VSGPRGTGWSAALLGAALAAAVTSFAAGRDGLGWVCLAVALVASAWLKGVRLGLHGGEPRR